MNVGDLVQVHTPAISKIDWHFVRIISYDSSSDNPYPWFVEVIGSWDWGVPQIWLGDEDLVPPFEEEDEGWVDCKPGPAEEWQDYV